MGELMPKAILFDLDDTILDFDSGADPCWRDVCGQFAAEVEGISAGQLRSAIDDCRRWFWSDPERHRRGRLNMPAARQEIVTVALSRLGVEAPGLAARIAGAYSATRAETLRLLPGAIEALKALRSLGIKLALVTNGDAAEQRAKIERFDLAPLFDCIVIEGEFGAGKPDEQVYRHVLAQLEVRPGEAWMVGDNLEWDVAAAQSVGMLGIWCDAAGTGLPASSAIVPDRIIRTLAELVPA